MAVVPVGYGLAPYCGSPPTPLTVLARWNLDPALIIVLLAAVASYLVASRNAAGGSARWRKGCFLAGWLLGALALTSPLCPLSVSLFCARVGQHMLLTTVVAPLIVLGCGGLRQYRQIMTDRDDRTGGGVMVAAFAYAAALWIWHAPGPYMATFTSDIAYWAMHLSVFGAACWLWAGLLNPDGGHPMASLAAALATTVQMGFLGAFITFAAKPLYAAHTLTTAAWSLTQIQDQQLGGAIMWIPAGAVLMAAIVLSLGDAINRSEARAWTPTAG